MSAWHHLGQGLLLGCGLGLMYSLLRPFRPRWLGDLLFLIALFWTWLYLGFGLCEGDLRTAYTLSLVAGIFLWNYLFGSILHPFFSAFWKYFFQTLHYFLRPVKKILKKIGNFLFFLFASSKKWVTIECNHRLSKWAENRRNTHAQPFPSDPTGLSPQLPVFEDPGAGHHFGFHCCAGSTSGNRVKL